MSALPELKLYNTLTRCEEIFNPIEPGKVRMYVCGPTVYDEAHLGHARCYITWDVLFRFLKLLGYDVTYVRNVTDVDDKILNRAKENNQNPTDLALHFEARFDAVMDDLNVAMPTQVTRATEYVDAMIDMVQTLLDKGVAYQAPDKTIYFDTSQVQNYGQLKKQDLSDMEAGARVEVDPGKKSPLDFALWKPADPSEPLVWQAPFGPGRPGWHIECSAMNRAVLGDQIDIHCGGLDLIFPHHENEIAQSEACTGVHPFSRVWMHNGFVNVSGEKMSKSLGNFSTIAELLKVYDTNTIRYFILTNHYRSPVDFKAEALDAAKNRVVKIQRNVVEALKACQKEAEPLTEVYWSSVRAIRDNPDFASVAEKLVGSFFEAMQNDLNTASALASLNELLNALNKASSTEEKLPLLGHFLVLSSSLGFKFDLGEEQPALDGVTDELMKLIIDLRQQAREDKNWGMSDQIRDRLAEIGIQLKDQKDGPTTWEKV